MPEVEDSQAAAETSTSVKLEGQTYEIIRKRMQAQAESLRNKLDQLNHHRKEVFGSIETALTGTERVTTDNNCMPRDMVAIGDCFLFGYNVHVGLRSETVLNDVFSIYEYSDQKFHAKPLELIKDERFERDFKEIYKYYKNATFARFSIQGPFLFMVFRIGAGPDDTKSFKWAIENNTLHYVDNRSGHEYKFPPQHEFQWKSATRDHHQSGHHPHISIEDRLFVETIGGDLTIKIENNTESGEGIYAEDVAHQDQTLDDAKISYAIVGSLIFLKILPYQEKEYRHIVYSEKRQQAQRLDEIAEACVMLPDDQGVIFPQGCFLQSGDYKTFETNVEKTVFTKRIRSTNGEDYLYVFYNRTLGTYVLLSYNVISQEVATPLVCSGYALFDTGELITFRDHEQPEKHHAIQIWKTPFLQEQSTTHADTGSYLFKIGNPDLVRGMAECHEVLNLIHRDDSYANLYLDLVKLSTDIIDSYFWIDHEETFSLKDDLAAIRDSAAGAISEFDKVVRMRRDATKQVQDVTTRTKDTISTIGRENFSDIGIFVRSLSELRSLRGEIISLRDVRYVPVEKIDTLEKEVRQQSDLLATRCVDFLLQPESLASYQQQVETENEKIGTIEKVSQAKEIQEKIATAADELEMLVDIVSNLKIDDSTQRTTIIDNISSIFSRLNQTRAALKKKTKELMITEGAAEFHSQLKLLNQAVVNYLDICDSPQKCEEFLTKLMIQVEELEGRFSEFDEFVLQLSEKRDEVYNAFEARRLALVESQNRRTNTLEKSATRILKGIKSRVGRFESVNEINGYFAADLMIEKVRNIVQQLLELEDTVKVDDIQSQLKTIREDAVRQLKDRQELYVDGKNIIQFGRHQFSVNVQTLDLTTVMRDNELCFHLTGTKFFEPVTDQKILATRAVWDQEVVSENKEVYRSQYLASMILNSLGTDPLPTLVEIQKLNDDQLLELIQKFMAPRYSEGYVKGVHDHDAAIYLRALIDLKSSIGLLRFSSPARALANLFWIAWPQNQAKDLLQARLKGFGRITKLFANQSVQTDCIAELVNLLNQFVEKSKIGETELITEAAKYLFHTVAHHDDFVVSLEADEIFTALHNSLESQGQIEELQQSLADVEQDTVQAYCLARDWAAAFVNSSEGKYSTQQINEVAVLLVEKEYAASRVNHCPITRQLAPLLGNHPAIEAQQNVLQYNQFTTRLDRFSTETVSMYQQYTHHKKELVDEFREELRLEEFEPRVLTSFVRNQLIDKVYLPLVGDNLAKQIGTSGEDKRTDRMGLLLVISPPGYGKTTLMEYIANRLGIIFMKINGPVIGHQVTSLDPQQAPNAGAREEVEKLNLSLEMGDNVMIYLDDIQHCNPEFLQKFISLCDAQRKIEGVYKGRSQTYDLRGRKVCVVMAGNPYTESGEKFQIPDMLANRADVYNLGEIIGDNARVFEMSYLENSMTSNPTLSHIASKNPKDVYAIIKIAETGSQEAVELEGNYSPDELSDYVSTMKKMLRVRDVVLKVNREYIRSAAQSNDYRTEPAFKLQGSYRNMNKIAEKISPIMNDGELEITIYSIYENDAQTLTSGTEANLLKFKELIGTITPEEQTRWEAIKRTFQRNLKTGGLAPDDKFGQVIAQMGIFSDGLDAIKDALSQGIQHLSNDQEEQSQLDKMLQQFSQFGEGLSEIQETLAAGVEHLGQRAIATPDSGKNSTDAVQLMQKLATEISVAIANSSSGPGKEHKINIINKVPRSVLAVIREQFFLMQQWVEPLLKAADSNNTDLKKIGNRLEETINHYRTLIERLEADNA